MARTPDDPAKAQAWLVQNGPQVELELYVPRGNKGDPGGIVITILLGIVGAVVGGFLGTALGFGSVTGFDVRSLLIAIAGTLVLLFAYRFFTSRATA